MENLVAEHIKDFKAARKKLEDDKSKERIVKRLQYSITNDQECILKMGAADKIREVLKRYQKLKRPLIIFGAGFIGQRMVNTMLNDVLWECFVDNNIKGKISGLEVFHPNELKSKYSNAIVVISPLKTNLEIYDQLTSLGFPKEQIINFGELILEDCKSQYFDVLEPDISKESFVDCGCCDGQTSKLFAKWCNGNYSNIWAFEPDLDNYLVCKEQLDLPNCKLYNLGTFDRETTVKFKGGFCGGSKISSEGDNEIRTVKLDDIIRGEKITFIKMDVEGAEFNSLQGAEQIIRTQKPKLAICIYHKAEDIISIPKLILEYNPSYKLKIRHYGISPVETVLYAF